MLDTLAPAERGGGPRKPRDAMLSPARHTPGDQRGQQLLTAHGREYQVMDYGDKLQLQTDQGRDVQKSLGLVGSETKQCVLLALAAAVLWEPGKPAPPYGDGAEVRR